MKAMETHQLLSAGLYIVVYVYHESYSHEDRPAHFFKSRYLLESLKNVHHVKMGKDNGIIIFWLNISDRTPSILALYTCVYLNYWLTMCFEIYRDVKTVALMTIDNSQILHVLSIYQQLCISAHLLLRYSRKKTFNFGSLSVFACYQWAAAKQPEL